MSAMVAFGAMRPGWICSVGQMFEIPVCELHVALIGSFARVYFYLSRSFNFCSLNLFILCCATIHHGEIKLYI